ncbi:amino acid permease [Polychaeton citri CBS 116435]|uniref:Amino acid permease n=1 Tax=Polychaeton citri CBS 116435 TaxID=1314669 RepID=A0A9P4Q4V1_9PEZI|nr:amino acid permease [Polychaeton citri CBS 116435]
MDPYEMAETKYPNQGVFEEDEKGVIANAYPGQRTEGTRDERTRVKRVFSFAQIFFFALTFMSSWETMALNLQSTLYNGGPRALAWGILIVVAGALAQTASLAEMSSAQPIAGAQYHWTHAFAPAKQRRFITYMQGWVTWFAWVSTLAGVANTSSYMLQSLVAANYPNYAPQAYHVTLIIFALLIVEGLMNMFAWFLIPWFELLAGILHIVLFIIFVVVFVTLAPRQSAEFVFFKQASSTGWTNSFISFNLGLMTPTWGFVGFDGAVHMSEEVRKARHAVPRAMFWTIALNGLLAYAIILVILFCIGDLDAALNADFPIIEICTQATGSLKAATAMVCGLLVISVAVTLGSIASASRLTWAWARDGGLPAWFSHISPRHRVPIRSIWLPILIVMCLACLNIASYTAFSAFISLASLALYTSYAIAIGCMLHARLRDRVQYGGWTLGKFGVPINVFALIYSGWMMVFFCFPTYLPVTGDNMNYALPIFAFVVLVALVLWFTWASRHWPGLNKEVINVVMADSDRNTKE